MMTPQEAKRRRLILIHWLDEIGAGVAAEDPEAIETARDLLAKIAIEGNNQILSHVWRGVILAQDETQPAWEKLFP